MLIRFERILFSKETTNHCLFYVIKALYLSMETITKVLTSHEQFTDVYNGPFFDHYQIHIFSAQKIISAYYDPTQIALQTVTDAANNLLKVIAKLSERPKTIRLFHNSTKFLIAEHSELIDPVEMLFFNDDKVKYEPIENNDDLYAFLGTNRADVFIKNAFTTVGAIDLFSIVEPLANKLRLEQEENDLFYAELRELIAKDPKFRLEFYRIEKNYIPRKISEMPSHGSDTALFLPENMALLRSDSRITYLVKEMETNEIIDGDINEAIESIKYKKWFKKHPSVIDFNVMQRMELDKNDPDFISWDEYVANDDEFEEGDDEYSPS
jgi:hypothetical protein